MSLYTQCSEAATRLMKDPPEGNGGVFTEIDVVRAANDGNWSAPMFRSALKQANQLLGNLYRSRRLVRYGPVKLDGVMDYARIASKIVYASAENGPEYWQTPNGAFPRFLIDDDEWSHQGRRSLSNRNDLDLWERQEILTRSVKIDPVVNGTDATAPAAPAPAQQLERMRVDLAAAYRQLDEVRQENDRLRTHRSKSDDNLRETVGQIVVELVGDMDERVRRLERIEERRREVYAGG